MKGQRPPRAMLVVVLAGAVVVTIAVVLGSAGLTVAGAAAVLVGLVAGRVARAGNRPDRTSSSIAPVSGVPLPPSHGGAR